ncbi:MAG: thiamine-phosphate kinase [Terracidiphilus sp.]|jgi:thiamine-monophosphate kinase
MPRAPKKSNPSNLGELALIQRIRLRAAQTPTPELRLGIGDDCAILRPAPGEELAVTTDLSIAGRHFRLDWHPAESVGHRALARGLSDLAAMGARPVAAFLSLAVPRNLAQKPKARNARGAQNASAAREAWIDRFLDGFLALAQEHQVPLAGGDLAQSTLAVADVVLTGAIPQGEALLRSGARPGDLIYVTGSLGAAAAGLHHLAKLAAAFKRARPRPKPSALPHIPPRFMALLTPHLYPTPRVAQGLWLAHNAMATAAIDLSDGLSTDLAHLCAESGVAAELDAAALPFAPGANPAKALNGGEDYELLFTAPPAARVPSSIEGVPVTQIGRIVGAHEGAARKATAQSSAPPITLITPKGAVSLTPQGWQHFS